MQRTQAHSSCSKAAGLPCAAAACQPCDSPPWLGLLSAAARRPAMTVVLSYPEKTPGAALAAVAAAKLAGLALEAKADPKLGAKDAAKLIFPGG